MRGRRAHSAARARPHRYSSRGIAIPTVQAFALWCAHVHRPDITPTPASPPGDPRPDDDAAWAERRLAILSELAEAGLEIALALKTRIVETAAAEPDTDSARACADLARAFDRASRAVRMSIALRDRVAKDASLSGQAARDSAHEARGQRAGRVRRIVGRIAEVRYTERATREAFDSQARERLYDRDITGDLKAPIGALVARICADLGLAPRWTAMAQEAWAQEEITERPPGSPYAAWPDLAPDEPDPKGPESCGDGDWDEQLEDDEADDFGDEDDGEPDDPGGGGP
ncbi:MAG: hypothetical protein JWP35_1785 [Caulobacter sp.]|nr:hypothetical protein [Caulobacter sp.]